MRTAGSIAGTACAVACCRHANAAPAADGVYKDRAGGIINKRGIAAIAARAARRGTRGTPGGDYDFIYNACIDCDIGHGVLSAAAAARGGRGPRGNGHTAAAAAAGPGLNRDIGNSGGACPIRITRGSIGPRTSQGRLRLVPPLVHKYGKDHCEYQQETKLRRQTHAPELSNDYFSHADFTSIF
jgi:hypothetical protein